ncbi:MAG: phosphate regulon sensor histidine kinase PhoR [Gammaproteobacteria bacterium]|nr:phosphate regulon sensor histidine kinase PhoR [Gammaproteobacteria bacterium]
MRPVGWARDLLLLAALALLGAGLGGALDACWAGFALGVLCYQLISYRRLLGLHHWLAEDALRRESPVLGGMLGDIGDRMYYQQARLRKRLDEVGGALEHLRESYAALKDGVVMLDAGNVIAWCNASASGLLGLRYPQDVGQQLLNLVRNPDFAAYLNRQDFERSFELTLSGRVLELQATAFGASSKIVFVRDTSAMKYLETMRRDFVANISHELRTPLTVISGYVDTLVQMQAGQSPVMERALAQMQGEAQRMEFLLRDLMLLSKLESGPDAAAREEWIDVCAMLDSVRENALASCRGERQIELACTRGLRILGERTALESVFSNLIFNAVRYTAPGGSIRVSCVVQSAAAVVEVSDNGIGIDPIHIPRLTERFYRVDQSRSIESGGTGLGLAIVKHALKRLGGELDISSRPGVGSTFRCRFRPERVRAD